MQENAPHTALGNNKRELYKQTKHHQRHKQAIIVSSQNEIVQLLFKCFLFIYFV